MLSHSAVGAAFLYAIFIGLLVAAPWKNWGTTGFRGDQQGDSPFRPWMEILISLIILVVALYALFFKADADAGLKQWSTGALGTILGFWLKR